MGIAITVLGSTGQTGREIVRQALERGHDVTAIARDPSKLDFTGLRRLAADVRDPESVAKVLAGAEVIVSALGVAEGERPGVLTDGARAAVASGAGRMVWLSAVGTGRSAAAAGWLTRTLLKAMSDREDKETADALIMGAGGTVFHAGPMSGGPLSPTRRTAGLDAAPRRIFPARVSRATVAAAMLDEAESPRFAGGVALPLER